MADDVARALEAIAPADADDDALVFPDPMDGLELRPAALLRRMRTALKAAGLEETHRFHDLRHTFGTRMAARGVPMRTLQEWMGHKDIATTQRYADYAPRHDERQLVQSAFAVDSRPLSPPDVVHNQGLQDSLSSGRPMTIAPT